MVNEIIYLTGLPGAGKSATVEAFRQHGVATFYTGNIHPETGGKDRFYVGDEHFETEHEFIERALLT